MDKPFDLLDWQKRLRELAAVKPESEWADPFLNKLEDVALADASRDASAWMYKVWKWALLALSEGTERSYDVFLDKTEDDPVSVDDASTTIVMAFEKGYERGKRQLLLSDKGSRIDVPPRPTEKRVVKRTIYPKQAEWVARQSAASKMREWSEGMREDIRWQVVQAIREGISPETLADRLKKRWDVQGAHFQTIASTEMGMAYNDAILTQLAEDYVVVPVIGDEKVCKACKKKLEGKVFWVSPVPIDNPTKQEYEQYVWPGKSNVGRLVENWWACVPMHPNCRHIYVRYRGGNPYDYVAKGGTR